MVLSCSPVPTIFGLKSARCLGFCKTESARCFKFWHEGHKKNVLQIHFLTNYITISTIVQWSVFIYENEQ